MLEDEFVIDELEQPLRVEGSTANVYEVLDVISDDLSAVYLAKLAIWLTYSSVSGLGVTVLRPLTSRTVMAWRSCNQP
jgi:hypothetical protein